MGIMVKGCFEQFKPKLSCLTHYVLEQSSNTNKFIRAISCWCISSILSSIMKDSTCKFESCPLANNSMLLLIEKLEDPSIIVVKAAYTALLEIICQHKEIAIKYLQDLLNSISKLIQPFIPIKSILYDLVNRVFLVFNDCYHIYSNAFVEVKKALNLDWRYMITSIHNLLTSDWEIHDKSNYSSFVYFFDFYTQLTESKVNLIDEFCIKIAGDTLEELKSIRECMRTRGISSDKMPSIINLLSYKLLYLFSVIIQYYYHLLEAILQTTEIMDDLLFFGKHKALSHYCISIISRLVDIDHFEVKQKLDPIIKFLDQQLIIPSVANQDASNFQLKEEVIEISVLLSCGNSAWTLSIISMKYTRFWSYTESVLEKLKLIFYSDIIDKFLLQNASFLLGRLALTNYRKISVILPLVLNKFLISLRSTSNSRAKQEAFTGICNAIIFNPAYSVPHLALILDSIVMYSDAPPSLQMLFQELLHSLRRNLREKWESYISVVPTQLRGKLRERFLIWILR